MGPMILAAYTRYYSEIPAIQKAGRVEYTLCQTEEGLRLVVRATGAKRRATVCELPGLDNRYACCLLQYLYENGVAVEHVRDVVQDLRPAFQEHLLESAPQPDSDAGTGMGDWPELWSMVRTGAQ